MRESTVHLPLVSPRFSMHFGWRGFQTRPATVRSSRRSSPLTGCRRGALLSAAGLVVWLLAAPRLHAASLSGAVLDPEGRPVPGASVNLLSALNAVEERTAGPEGRYRFEDLEPGAYKLVANAAGFSALTIDVKLDASQSRNLDLRLKLGAVEQQVVVSASLGAALTPQVGSSVSVLNRQEMEERGNQTVFDALRAVPGVAVSQSGRRGGVTSLFVRGGASDYNLVLIDGVQVNQFGGSFDFAPLTTDGVERVEVTRSPESALYGTNAVSSVVDIRTERGEGPPHFSLNEEAGSFATWRIGAAASGLSHGLGWALGASRLDSGGVVPNDQYRDQTSFASLSYPSGGRRHFNFDFFGNANNAGDPGAYGSDPDHLFAGIDRTSRDKQNLFGYALNYSEQFTSRFRQVTTGTVSTNNYDFLSSFGNELTHNLRAVFNTRSEILVSSQDFLVGGFEYNREQIKDTFIADTNSNPFLLPRTTLAYFAENRWAPTSRWTITAGVRADDIRTSALPPDTFGERPAIPASSIVQVNPHVSVAGLVHLRSSSGIGATRVHASFGTGIRAPNGFELAFTDNPQLKPERSLSFDAGVEQRFLGDRAVLQFTYFYNRFWDQIEVLGGSLTNLSTFTSANIGNARAEGAETSFRFQPAPAVRIEAGYTFLSSSLLALDGTSAVLAPFEVGQPLIRRPRHSGFYAIAWSRNRLTLSSGGYFRGHVLDLEPNFGTFACAAPPLGPGLQCLFENDGYARLDGGFSYRAYRGLEVYGQVYNFLDRHYEEVLGYPALPLNFMAGIRFNFPSE
jgi:outer membrane cobalamin receptor